MINTQIVEKGEDPKIFEFGSDKNLTLENDVISKEDSLLFWVENYFAKMVIGGKEKTQMAKKMDLQKFLSFFIRVTNSYYIDSWTPSLTKEFQKFLLSEKSSKTGQGYKVTTINRIFATLKHLASWIADRREFKAGNPFEGVRDLMQDEPDWNGLTDHQLMLLRGAIDIRLKICTKDNQNPLLEAVTFYTLLNTGLREFEFCSLTIDQYYNKGFHEIKRKGNMITKKAFISEDARQRLEEYLKWRQGVQADTNFMFINRYLKPITPTAVRRMCARISKQACINLREEDKFILTPHQLRHTCLKRANDKYGLSFAKKLSGNVGIREIYRYTAPSQDEVEEKMEGLF